MLSIFDAEIVGVTILNEERSGRVTYYPEGSYNKQRVAELAENADTLLYAVTTHSTSKQTAILKAQWCVRRHNPWTWTGMSIISVTKSVAEGLTDKYRIEVSVNR